MRLPMLYGMRPARFATRAVRHRTAGSGRREMTGIELVLEVRGPSMFYFLPDPSAFRPHIQ